MEYMDKPPTPFLEMEKTIELVEKIKLEGLIKKKYQGLKFIENCFAGDEFTFQDGKRMVLSITKESLTNYFDKARKDLEKEKFDVEDMI